ncbi:glutamate receptor ionotropic, delta-1-like isoform X2 [Eriocheir sinensis]|uniref:glutamate receptor ionotropic, delta-1-like isoform X2 n=1 Tax=Eriocheir sinensis TaxID=95602 RepID=UPI0021C7C5AD|nr:glutamate receptor ionotropic, delta-1-like isoform X2 [Eriocheir sinensis]
MEGIFFLTASNPFVPTAMRLLIITVIWTFIEATGSRGLGVRERTRGSETHELEAGAGGVVANMVPLLKLAAGKCDLTLAAHRYSPVLASRLLRVGGAVTVVGLSSRVGPTCQPSESLAADGGEANGRASRGELAGQSKAKCRAVVLDAVTGNTSLSDWFLSSSVLWLRPEMRLVVVGHLDALHSVISHRALRNTDHVVFIAPRGRSHGDVKEGRGDGVAMYRRCLFCNEGDVGIVKLYPKSLQSGAAARDQLLFPDDAEGFHGHRFRVVVMEYFPYISYTRQESGALRLTDSLNTRMITHLAELLNFTYEVMEPDDCQWGLEADGGNWTGIVGTLQHEKADFSMDLTLTPQRATVVDFCRLYIDENLGILSLKPRPPPEYLSLIRPFETKVWVATVVSVMVWGVTLWLLLKIRHRTFKGRRFDLRSALFYSWGLLLEDSPNEPPDNPTGQVLVGMWLLACLILRTTYVSSLISHLVKGGESPVINTIEEMVKSGQHEGRQWGTVGVNGAINSFLITSTNPAFHVANKFMQSMGPEEGTSRVLAGEFSFILNYYAIRVQLATLRGASADIPVHISTTKYPLFPGNGWAFRRGTPFLSRFNLAIQRLLDAGLIDYWMDDVINTYVTTKRLQDRDSLRDGKIQASTVEDTRGQVVLGLRHLQVTFYILFAGHAAGTLSFLAESSLT